MKPTIGPLSVADVGRLAERERAVTWFSADHPPESSVSLGEVLATAAAAKAAGPAQKPRPEHSKPCVVYKLEWADGSYYIGSTVDLRKRLERHRASQPLGPSFSVEVMSEHSSEPFGRVAERKAIWERRGDPRIVNRLGVDPWALRR